MIEMIEPSYIFRLCWAKALGHKGLPSANRVRCGFGAVNTFSVTTSGGDFLIVVPDFSQIVI